MSNFNSNKVQVFPTAYRCAQDNNNKLIKNSLTARLNTEYNITNLVDGLLDQDINNGNFVISYVGNLITFCMKGYYFKVELDNDVSSLWVKLNTSTNLDYGREMVPENFNSSRDLDVKDSETYQFKGLTYVTSDPSDSDYFQLLSNGSIPDKSKLKFSTGSVGYIDGNNVWHSIREELSVSKLTANQLIFIPATPSNKDQALMIDNQGNIKLSDLTTQGQDTSSENYGVISAVSQDAKGKISVNKKTLPVSTNVVDSTDTSNVNLVTRYAVKDYADGINTSLNNAKINKTDLVFSYNNGVLTITDTYNS